MRSGTPIALFLTLFLPSAINAQQFALEPAPGYIVNGLKPQEGAIRAEAAIWSEDFANGIPAGWTQISDPSGAAWEYRGPTTTPSNLIGSRGSCVGSNNQFAQPILSPTADNGFIIFDSNFWDDNIGPCGSFGQGEVPGPHYAALVTDDIDLTGYTSIGLRINQYCRNFQAAHRIEYSIAEDAWQVLWTNNVPLSSGHTPRDRFDRINISNQLGNQANIRLRFVFEGNYYFWMLDDIQIFEIFENNLVVAEAEYGNFIPFNTVGSGYQDMEYGMYPEEMQPNLFFKARTYNWGSQTQTGAQLFVDVVNDLTLDTLYSAMSGSATVLPDVLHTFTAPQHQLEATPAPYSIHYRVEQDQEDGFPEANHAVRNFLVDDITYARDRLSTEGIFVPSAGLVGPTYELGNFYQITAEDQVAQSISVGLGIGTSSSATVYGRIYKVNFTDSGIIPEIIAETNEIPVITAAFNNVGDNKVMVLPLNEHVTLQKDSAYLVAVGAPGGAASVLFPVSGNSADYTSMARFYPNSWFYFIRTPLIRLNFGFTTEIDEMPAPAKLEMVCYPNPAAYNLNLGYTLPENAAVEFRIYDQTGRIVLSEPQGTQSAGEHRSVVDVSGLAAGWYVASLVAGNAIRNEMMVIRR